MQQFCTKYLMTRDQELPIANQVNSKADMHYHPTVFKETIAKINNVTATSWETLNQMYPAKEYWNY